MSDVSTACSKNAFREPNKWGLKEVFDDITAHNRSPEHPWQPLAMTHSPLSDDVLSQLAHAQRVSKGELDALKLALKQRKNKDIAKQLGISEAAARKRLGEVYKKFGIRGKGPGKLGALERHLLAQAQQKSAGQRQSSQIESSQASKSTLVKDAHKRTIEGARNTATDEQLPSNPQIKTRYHWNGAPAIALNHVRREIVTPLKQWILKPTHQTKLLAICGMGGIGKTAIALKLAKELNGYFEQVIWLSAESQQSPNDFLQTLLSVLSEQASSSSDCSSPVSPPISSASPSTQQTTQRLIQQLIVQFSQHRYLVILDGYERVFSHSSTASKHRTLIPTFEASRQQQASLYQESLGGYGALLQALQQNNALVSSSAMSCLI